MEKTPRNSNEAKMLAQKVAAEAEQKLGIPKDKDRPMIGIVLGTGWGEAISFQSLGKVSLEELEGFDKLEGLNGSDSHKRVFEYGKINGGHVLILRGRIHMHEAHFDEDVIAINRLTTQIFMEMGIRRLILTCAVGTLIPNRFPVGSICVVDRFITLFAGAMPGFGFEFKSAEDTLCRNWRHIALAMDGLRSKRFPVRTGTHVMVPGPFFEGRKRDKDLLREFGASVVGMSALPEASIAALYDAKILVLAYVTNGPYEVHSDDVNRQRLKESGAELGSFLVRVVSATKVLDL